MIDSESPFNHARHCFKAFVHCHLKLLCPRTGRWLRSAALHRIQFRTCCFVPMSYFYSETNEWSQDWAKRWARLWSATTSGWFHWNFISQWKTPSVCARPSDPPKLCWSAAPRAWPLILQSNPSIVFSNSLREWLPDDTLVGRGGFTNPHPQDWDKLYGPCARPLQPYLPSIYVLFSSISDAWDIHTSFLDQPLMQLVIANAQFEPHKMIRVLHVKKVERKLQTILNFWW